MNVESEENTESIIENKGLQNLLNNTDNPPGTSLKEIIRPLINEMKLLWDNMHNEYSKFDHKLENAMESQKSDFNKLESTLATQQKEITTVLSDKIEVNSTNINQLLEENRLLKHENISLQEQITWIEVSQAWETNDTTKERVVEAIAASMGLKDDADLRKEAKKVEISCWSRVGIYKLGKPRPISVTFQKRDDKEILMAVKKNL